MFVCILCLVLETKLMSRGIITVVLCCEHAQCVRPVYYNVFELTLSS